MRLTRLVLAPAALLAAAGCFQGQRTIKVNADGSGTIVDTLTPGEQMKAMMAAAEEQDKAKQKEKGNATAAAMGPGVAFVSEEKTPDGGRKATFAFKDIGKIKVEPTPGPGGGDDKQKSSEEPLTFRFARQGGKSVLTVVQPQPKKAAASSEKPGEGMEQMAEQMAQGMWTMMKGMMKGLKLKSVVEVNGKLVRTTSRYAEGSTVTLLELDFDQVTADDANFKKFTKAGADPSTMDPKLLQDIKGVKANPEPEIVIEFTGK